MESVPSTNTSAIRAPGRLHDKVAIVTGSSSGLGRAIAIRYAQEGAKVVCSDLRPNARMDIAGEASVETHQQIVRSGGDAIFVQCNVASAVEWEALIKATAQAYGRLDVYRLHSEMRLLFTITNCCQPCQQCRRSSRSLCR